MTTLQNLSQTLVRLQAQGLERLDAQLLLLHVLNKPQSDRGWLLSHDTDNLPVASADLLRALARRRLAGEPLAYLTGGKDFYGLNLHVSPDVLVPRPDTETLVDWLLQGLPAAAPQQDDKAPGGANEADRVRVLDLGTGSGAIALAVKASRPDVHVSATDLSATALAIAQSNAQRLKLHIEFNQGPWLAALPAGSPPFDLIASNPPYIAERDPHLAALRFEPLQALTSGSDGLKDLRQIVASAPVHLKAGGWLLLEHGYDQAAAVCQLLLASGFTRVQSRCDLAGIERCSGGQIPL
jgi:release factor glutamine methyltransferase